MRILLIAFNRLTIPQRIAPVGALYLAASLRQRGHEVRLVDLMFSRSPGDDVREALLSFKPDVVGGSIRNVDTVAGKEKSFLSDYRDILSEVRALTRAPLVLGGSGFSNFPREIMRELNPDFGMVGEADRTFPALLDALLSGESPLDVPGLVSWQGDDLLFAPVDTTQDLNEIPHQAIDLIDPTPYKKHRGTFGVLTRRSCTQRCLFCNESALHGQKVRLRAPRLIVDELKFLVKSTGMRHYGFADPIFNSPHEHMLEILEEIIRQKLNIRLRVEMNPIGLDDESVKLLARAGCEGVDFTADAGAEKMFRALGKGYHQRDVLRGAELFHRYKIPYNVGFLLGGPGENISTVIETIKLAKALPAPQIVYFSVGLVLLPGAALEKIVGERAEIKQPDDLLEIRYHLARGFDERCAKLLLRACQHNRRFFITESLWSPALAPLWALADRFNLRSSWQYPRIAKLMLRLWADKGEPYWDAPRRRFCTTRAPLRMA